MRTTSSKSSLAISRQRSPKANTPRPWLMLKPSHARHMEGRAWSPPGIMRRRRTPVPSSAGLSDGSTGAKKVGRTVSRSVPSACRPPATISGIVPAMNHACAAPLSIVPARYHTYMHVRMGRPTQAERSARTRSALLESAARGLSRYGYGNLVLEQVARDAGYTRGALYHQFKDKEDLTLAVLEWVDETWRQEVGEVAAQA